MSLSCPITECALSKDAGAGSIIRHGFYKTRSGKRRRYRCRSCGKTFCSNTGTPYHRLQHRRTTFDEVATLSVEGLNKSAIARVKQIAWNTVHRWLQKAASSCRRFNDRRINGIAITSFRRMRSVRSSTTRNNPFGSSPRSRSGLGFGLRQSWEDEAIGTHSSSSGISSAERSRTCPSDCHGRILLLCEGHPPCLWTRVCTGRSSKPVATGK